MTLRAKLILAFTMVACVPLVGGAIGLYSHRAAVRRAEMITRISNQAARLLDDAWAVQAGLDCNFGKPPGNATEILRIAEDRLIHLRVAAAELGVPPEITGGIGNLPGAFTDPARQPAVRALVQAVQAGLISALRPEEQAFVVETRMLDLVMGVGTLFGIALGIGFGVVTSFAVTRHIRGIAGQIWDKTTQVAASVTQVAASSRDLAVASSQQAAALEETNAALIEVNTIVKANAARAHDARAIAHENRTESDRSAGEVAALQDAMKEMSVASASIAKIVRSIDEIAFQTNILALNAAVESARAGAAGAGFAVVADEVRGLAQRSAAAARETSHQIADAQAKSTRGAELAARVEESLRRVIRDAHRVDTLIGHIAEASGEQARGLDQAVVAMKRIDELTQSNTASAEQTAAIAEQLDAETHTMRAQLSGLTEGARAGSTSSVADPEKRPPACRSAEGTVPKSRLALALVNR